MRIRDWENTDVATHVNSLLRRAKKSVKVNFKPEIELPGIEITVREIPRCDHLWLILIDGQEFHIIHEDIQNHLIYEGDSHHPIVGIFRRL